MISKEDKAQIALGTKMLYKVELKYIIPPRLDYFETEYHVGHTEYFTCSPTPNGYGKAARKMAKVYNDELEHCHHDCYIMFVWGQEFDKYKTDYRECQPNGWYGPVILDKYGKYHDDAPY